MDPRDDADDRPDSADWAKAEDRPDSEGWAEVEDRPDSAGWAEVEDRPDSAGWADAEDRPGSAGWADAEDRPGSEGWAEVEDWLDVDPDDGYEAWAAAVVTAAEQIVAERGVVSGYDELARLVDDTLDEPDLEAEAMEELLADSEGVYDLTDGRVADLGRLCQGLTVTRQLGLDEAEGEWLRFGLDLLPLSLVSLDAFPLATGGEAAVSHPEPSGDADDRDAWEPGLDAGSLGAAALPAPEEWRLSGPPGWLRGAGAGDLVALSWRGGALHVASATSDPAGSERAAAALRHAFDRYVGEDAAEDAADLVMHARADDAELFAAPVAPLPQLLAGAGLEAHGDWVAPQGFDWQAWRQAGREAAFHAHLQTAHDLDDIGVDAAKAVFGAYGVFTDPDAGVDPAWREAAAAALCYHRVAETVAGELLGGDGAEAPQLAAFAESLLGAAGRRWDAGAHYLLACCAEFAGDARAGEQHLLAALAADPDFEPALLDAAWYAEDRGDAVGALQRLRRAQVAEEEARLERVAHYAAPGPASAGRNDPCPCGSGRKHKLCCLPRRGWPLSERLGWLLAKLVAFCYRPPQRARLLAIAEARAVQVHGEAGLYRALADPLVADLVLFEGGLLETFLAVRGELLPADELALLRSWVGAPRRLCEVVEVRPDEGLVLLDLRSGERLEIRERLATHQVDVGESVFTRVVADGAGQQLIGGVQRVTVPQRASLLELLDAEPGAEDVAAWFAAAEGPPTLLNMEREPTVLCTATYQVPDPAAAAAALAACLDEADEGTYLERFEVDGQTWTRGSVRIDGDHLVVEANSEARIERLRATVEDAVAGAQLCDETREPFDAAAVMAEVIAAGGAPAGGNEDDLAPELVEELERHIAAYEEAWLDLPVPLFGGLTPREAVADPTRRDDVEQFLSEVERDQRPAAGPGRGMDPQRLRRLLKLGD